MTKAQQKLTESPQHLAAKQAILEGLLRIRPGANSTLEMEILNPFLENHYDTIFSTSLICTISYDSIVHFS